MDFDLLNLLNEGYNIYYCLKEVATPMAQYSSYPILDNALLFLGFTYSIILYSGHCQIRCMRRNEESQKDSFPRTPRVRQEDLTEQKREECQRLTSCMINDMDPKIRGDRRIWETEEPFETY